MSKAKKKFFMLLLVLILSGIVVGAITDNIFLKIFTAIGITVFTFLIQLVYEAFFKEKIQRLLYAIGIHGFTLTNREVGKFDKEAYAKTIEGIKNMAVNHANLEIKKIDSLKLQSKLDWIVDEGGGETALNNRNFYGTFQITSKKVDNRLHIVIGKSGQGKSLALNNYVKSMALSKSGKVPVIFLASSWKPGYSFENFLNEEFNEYYKSNTQVWNSLIDERRLLIILDGLDEKPGGINMNVLEEIYKYLENASIILSCRTSQFEQLDFALKPNTVVYRLQPFKKEKIEDALKNVKERTKILQMVENSPFLREIVQMPLMLRNLASLGKDDLNEINQDLIDNQSEEKIKHKIWEKTVAESFDRKWYSGEKLKKSRLTTGNEKKDLENFLAWLASNMAVNIFYMEGLQPKWLNSKYHRFIYLNISRIICSVLLFMCIGFFMSGPLDVIFHGLLAGIIISLLTLMKSIFDSKKKSVDTNQDPLLPKRVSTIKSAVKNAIFIFLIFGPVMMLYYGLSTPRQEMDLIGGIFSKTGAVAGCFVTLFFAVVFGVRFSWQTLKEDTKPVEVLAFNKKQFLLNGSTGGIFVGFVCWLATVVLLNYFPESGFADWLIKSKDNFPFSIPALGFWTGFLFGFPITGTLGYLNQVDISINKNKRESDLFSPNHGIRQSLKNAMMAAIWTAFLLGIVFSTIVMFGSLIFYNKITFQGTFTGIKHGIAFGLITGLWYGGFDLIQHYCLRFILYLGNYAPFNFGKHLDKATKLGLLVQRGSNYTFFHDSLRDFFHHKGFVLKKMGNLKNHLMMALTFFVILSLVAPVVKSILEKKYLKVYWQDQYGLKIIGDESLPLKVNSSYDFIAKQSIRLRVSSRNSIKVGGFIGYVKAEGTDTGFLGFPMGDKWNIIHDLPHASLMAVVNDSLNIQIIKNKKVFFPWESRVGYLDLVAGDSVCFFINDSEYQNNSGLLLVYLEKISN